MISSAVFVVKCGVMLIYTQQSCVYRVVIGNFCKSCNRKIVKSYKEDGCLKIYL